MREECGGGMNKKLSSKFRVKSRLGGNDEDLRSVLCSLRSRERS